MPNVTRVAADVVVLPFVMQRLGQDARSSVRGNLGGDRAGTGVAGERRRLGYDSRESCGSSGEEDSFHNGSLR
jgi:hypothetical protein